MPRRSTKKLQRDPGRPDCPPIVAGTAETRAYYRNRHGHWVNFDFISPWGVIRILNKLDEKGTREHLEIVEKIAKRRGLMDDAGNIIKPPPEPPATQG